MSFTHLSFLDRGRGVGVLAIAARRDVGILADPLGAFFAGYGGQIVVHCALLEEGRVKTSTVTGKGA